MPLTWGVSSAGANRRSAGSETDRGITSAAGIPCRPPEKFPSACVSAEILALRPGVGRDVENFADQKMPRLIKTLATPDC